MVNYRDMRAAGACAIAACFFLVFFAPLSCFAVTIEGRVFTDSAPLEGARIFIYKSYDDIKAGVSLIVSEAADKQGFYKLQVPEGEYFFVARGLKDGKEFFSYHGNNPINVESKNLWLTLTAHEVKHPLYSDGPISVRGVVVSNGKPVKDAFVVLYKPEDRRFKGRGFKTDAAEDDGTFNVTVPPGKYVVIAKKADGDNKIRPLKAGDLRCYYPDNPIEVKPGNKVEIEVPCSPKGERSSLAEYPALKANDYLTVEDLVGGQKYGIKGRITDVNGKPVSGIYMIAYKSADTTSPFISYSDIRSIENICKTDVNGNYFIPLNTDGYFRIVARSEIGSRPRTKELFSLYNGNPEHGINFKKGQIIDHIDMVVEEQRAGGSKGPYGDYANKPESAQ